VIDERQELIRRWTAMHADYVETMHSLQKWERVGVLASCTPPFVFLLFGRPEHAKHRLYVAALLSVFSALLLRVTHFGYGFMRRTLADMDKALGFQQKREQDQRRPTFAMVTTEVICWATVVFNLVLARML
jgi:hypothetical protein